MNEDRLKKFVFAVIHSLLISIGFGIAMGIGVTSEADFSPIGATVTGLFVCFLLQFLFTKMIEQGFEKNPVVGKYFFDDTVGHLPAVGEFDFQPVARIVGFTNKDSDGRPFRDYYTSSEEMGAALVASALAGANPVKTYSPRLAAALIAEGLITPDMMATAELVPDGIKFPRFFGNKSLILMEPAKKRKVL